MITKPPESTINSSREYGNPTTLSSADQAGSRDDWLLREVMHGVKRMMEKGMGKRKRPGERGGNATEQASRQTGRVGGNVTEENVDDREGRWGAASRMWDGSVLLTRIEAERNEAEVS